MPEALLCICSRHTRFLPVRLISHFDFMVIGRLAVNIFTSHRQLNESFPKSQSNIGELAEPYKSIAFVIQE